MITECLCLPLERHIDPWIKKKGNSKRGISICQNLEYYKSGCSNQWERNGIESGPLSIWEKIKLNP